VLSQPGVGQGQALPESELLWHQSLLPRTQESEADKGKVMDVRKSHLFVAMGVSGSYIPQSPAPWKDAVINPARLFLAGLF
jgi:hypothetical protein